MKVAIQVGLEMVSVMMQITMLAAILTMETAVDPMSKQITARNVNA